MQQTRFLNNGAAMMPNGAWLENEMEGAIASDMQLRLMKTPVISAIRDVLPDKSVKDDAELSALVTYIDKVSSGEVAAPTGDTVSGTGFEVTMADYERVYTARNQMMGNQDRHGVILNKYSTAKDAAKEFLRFVFSDRGGQLFAENIHQMPSFTLENPSIIEPGHTAYDAYLPYGRYCGDGRYHARSAACRRVVRSKEAEGRCHALRSSRGIKKLLLNDLSGAG